MKKQSKNKSSDRRDNPTRHLKGRGAWVKTVSTAALKMLVRYAENSGGRWCYATHPSEGSTPEHYHLLIKWDTPREWTAHARELERLDPHAHEEVPRSARACIRYMLHLDNPDKIAVDRSALEPGNWDRGQIETFLSDTNPMLQLVEYVQEHLRTSTIFEIARDLLDLGYKPGQITNAQRMLYSISQLQNNLYRIPK